MNDINRLVFTSDYTEGAHPAILEKLIETNMLKSAGYGLDEFSDSARKKIRTACDAPEADVFFLAGGTQANAVVIASLLRPYQGVIAADSGHISVHEAGAIEFGGHKVLTLPHKDGKITAAGIAEFAEEYERDENHDHMVMPGMVYISQPTEFGTLYSLEELKEISETCRRNRLFLYLDGARLAYALACPENDAKLPDLASLCDVFYIGGTKCGTLFGEAVVIPRHDTIPHLFTMIKQHGALLAKGRVVGIQFDTLFTDELYLKIGSPAITEAERIRKALIVKGYRLAFPSPTNQIFILLDKSRAEELSEKVELGFWENADEDHVIMRIATSWATQSADVDRLMEIL
ncbi:MAG: aminotransferase class V-fold PLP-dependent enzyme [Lachnospiraceae bacterium]|nr:aminotransferase class V-fold PLP-dependent enzyme [Lachnospiraceae bacterium]